MSHRATDWAIQQKGLKPATKLLLWQLADRHNGDTGRCDQSQDLLAEDCEMSRATVNRHLDRLEESGLIRRVKRWNPKTRKQENTSYLLALDHDFSTSQFETHAESQKPQKPCLNSGESRVSDCDTNPVREPGIEPVSVADGSDHPSFEEFWEAHPRARKKSETRARFVEALKCGVSPEQLISAAKKYRSENERNAKQYLEFSDTWLIDKRWEDYVAGEDTNVSNDITVFWAEKVKKGSYISSTAISPRVAREMVARELVTEAELAEAIGR